MCAQRNLRSLEILTSSRTPPPQYSHPTKLYGCAQTCQSEETNPEVYPPVCFEKQNISRNLPCEDLCSTPEPTHPYALSALPTPHTHAPIPYYYNSIANRYVSAIHVRDIMIFRNLTSPKYRQNPLWPFRKRFSRTQTDFSTHGKRARTPPGSTKESYVDKHVNKFIHVGSRSHEFNLPCFQTLCVST